VVLCFDFYHFPFWLFGRDGVYLFSILTMLIFLKKFFLFLLPLGLFFVFPLAVFVLSKEYYSVDNAILYQIKNQSAIIGFAYRNDNRGLKEMLVASKNPEVLALGTSITGQFRKEFFIESANFITASNAVVTLDEMKSFIEKLPPDNRTKLIIFGFGEEAFQDATKSPPKEKWSLSEVLIKSRLIYWDYLAGKFSLKDLWGQPRNMKNIGVNAFINNEGFREDGSYQYARILTNPNRKEVLKTTIDGVVTGYQKDRKGTGYQYPVSDKIIESLNELLALCQKKNMYVIGFLSPYPPERYQEIIRLDDVYTERALQLPKTVGKVFSDYGFDFYNFSDISVLGLDKNNTEFADSTHGTDKLFLRITMHMAERNKQLQKYVDLSKVQELLQNTKNDFLEFSL